MCLDTLGQDRLFEEDEQKLVVEALKTIISSWEELEKKLLLENRDTKIEMNDLEAKYKENVIIYAYLIYIIESP